jgi:hypothetical protein
MADVQRIHSKAAAGHRESRPKDILLDYLIVGKNQQMADCGK